MTAILLVALLGAAIAGIPGYILSYSFNRSNNAATDTSGHLGAPRGMFIMTFGGSFIGLTGILLLAKIPNFIPSDATDGGMIAALIVGTLAGMVGTLRGQKARASKR